MHLLKKKVNSFSGFFTKEYVLMFLFLFFLLAFRSPKDLFTPYLWAEDGTILIEGSITDGISGLITKGNGAYWIIQKSIALLCYWIVAPFGSIAALPILMQVVFKAFATLTFLYFTSDRFQWLVPDRCHRFLICVAIVLMLPNNSYDVVTCDTSLPFELLFPCFLLGLDLLCYRQEMPTIPQTLFLALLALSTASAMVMAAIAVCASVQYFFLKAQRQQWDWKEFLLENIKVVVVLIAVYLQISLVLSSGRVSDGLYLGVRLRETIKSFLFFPYWHLFHSYTAFLVGAILWLIFWALTKFPWKVGVFSFGFSFLMVLYCSFALPPEEFFTREMTGRYIFVNFQIATLMLGIVISRLWLQKIRYQRIIAVFMVCYLAFVAWKTYPIIVLGQEQTYFFETYANVYDADGSDEVRIPIAPWRPWEMTVPTELPLEQASADLSLNPEWMDGESASSDAFGTLHRSQHSGISQVGIGGQAAIGEQPLVQLFIRTGNSEYVPARLFDSSFDSEGSVQTRFEFHLDSTSFTGHHRTLALLGQAEDGSWHLGEFTIPILWVE